MFNKDSLIKISTMRENERQTVELMKDADGKKYLKRHIHSDKRKIYKALKEINHPNIPTVYLVEFNSDTVVYEEFIEGITLSELMERNTSLGKKDVCRVAFKILSALDALHSADIIHRDIKPDNIIIDNSLNVWLTDYDISRIYHNEISRDTVAAGTFGYAPIEQYGVLPTDFKSDIYSFGVTLGILLERFGIKGHMKKIADKCKRLDPAQRYQSVKQVKKALVYGKKRFFAFAFATALVVMVICLSILSSKNVPDSLKKDSAVTNTDAQEATGNFFDFGYGKNEESYSSYSNYADICVFSVSEPWEHLIFADDINKKGKIKLGKDKSFITADISLHSGVLSVNLSDEHGNEFNHEFKIDADTDESAINADLICYDFNCDGTGELLIGLSSGATGVIEKNFYNNIDYCLGWCVCYDKASGFTLCSEKMSSQGYAFWLNTDISKINVSWEDIGDITGYVMGKNQIISVR